MKASIEKLKAEYEVITPVANRFLDEMLKQFKELLAEKKIPLAAPIECRFKLWSSIGEKLKRKAVELQNIKDLNDLVGLRLILLFKRDVELASQLLTEYFTVLAREDAGQKLTEDQFGYVSLHCIIALPEKWLAVPTFRSMKGLKAEIQVRTMAQHIWAAASHILQYKQEAGVPMPLRRTVHRVSALLETVDLEFDRVLVEKETYKEALEAGEDTETLNVVSLEKVMDSLLPEENKGDYEDYASLLNRLKKTGIETQDHVKQLILKHLKAVIAMDKERVNHELKSDYEGCRELGDQERVDRGVFFTHVGFVRNALEFEAAGKFGRKHS
jgi:putative GTP pyrophosphokinase